MTFPHLLQNERSKLTTTKANMQKKNAVATIMADIGSTQRERIEVERCNCHTESSNYNHRYNYYNPYPLYLIWRTQSMNMPAGAIDPSISIFDVCPDKDSQLRWGHRQFCDVRNPQTIGSHDLSQAWRPSVRVL